MAKTRIRKLIEPYVITRGRKFRLKDVDPGDTAGFKPEKKVAEAALAEGVNKLNAAAGEALCAEQLGRPADLPGARCRG